MKRIVLLCLLCCILSAGLYSLTPPPPLKGISRILLGEASFTHGDFNFEFKPPPGWGIGNYTCHDNGSADLELYPLTMGYRCVIMAQCCNSHAQAVDAVKKGRQTLKKTKNLPDGFESKFDNAFFSCRVEGPFIIYTWYSIPKKEMSKNKQWDHLKSVFHAVPVKPQPQPLSFKDFLIKRKKNIPFDPITRTMDGWVFSHPTNPLYIFFKISTEDSALRQEDAFSYQMYFNIFELNANGYFYIDWHRKDLSNTIESYQYFVDKISQEMQMIDPHQTFGETHFWPDNQEILVKGNPFNIMVIGQQDFLIAYAVRAIKNDQNIRMDLIEEVSWSPSK